MSDLPIVSPVSLRCRSLLTRLAEGPLPGRGDATLQRSRERLAEYDDHLLEDLGITREQALTLGARPGWPAKDWWLLRGR